MNLLSLLNFLDSIVSNAVISSFSRRVSLKGLEAATQNRQRAEGWLSTHGYVKRKRKRKKIKVVFSDSLDTKVGIILLSTNTVVCFQATIQLSF